MTEISKAAAALGRRGGKVTSPRKAKAVRENGKLGGRPLKYCPECSEELDEQIALVNGTCSGCGKFFLNAEGAYKRFSIFAKANKSTEVS